MKKMPFRILPAAVCLAVLCSGCGSVNSFVLSTAPTAYDRTYTDPASGSAMDEPEEYDGYVKVGDADALKLYFNKKSEDIAVFNKKSGVSWYSTVDWKGYGYDEPVPIRKAVTASVLSLVYSDVNVEEGKQNTVYSYNEPHKLTTKLLRNGISLQYDFTKLNITVTVDISLDDNGLAVSVPSSGITEGDRYLLMSLQVLPSFGAGNHQDEGYVLQPNGSGSLMLYENYNQRSTTLKSVTIPVYSGYSNGIYDYYATTQIMNDWYEAPKPESAAFPLYGVKKNKDAFLAYMTLGDAGASVQISPEGYVVEFNRVCFSLEYRNTFSTIKSNISAGNSSDLATETKVDKTRRTQDYSIHYDFLSGEEANYSGMANTYRGYLLEQKILNGKAEPTAPLSLDIFCGIQEDQILMDKFVSMTSFNEAEAIVRALKDIGVEQQLVTLLGWSRDGYGKYPASIQAASQLGGSSSLRNLMDYTSSQDGIQLFARYSPLLAETDTGGFSIRKDAVYTGNTLPLTDSKYEWAYLFSPASVIKKMKAAVNKMSALGSVGYSLDGISRYVYDDFAHKRVSTRTQTASAWQRLLSSFTQPLALETGNQYALAYADYIYNVPDKSSETMLDDITVPFYEMVVHGSIAYSSDAGNLSHDEQLQKLKWIEYGCIPRYELTYNKASNLKYTSYTYLYTSYYRDWINKASSVYLEFNTELSGFWDSYIIRHQYLSDTLVYVEYSNGKGIYINYADQDAAVGTAKVGARNYLVAESEGTEQ